MRKNMWQLLTPLVNILVRLHFFRAGKCIVTQLLFYLNVLKFIQINTLDKVTTLAWPLLTM